MKTNLSLQSDYFGRTEVYKGSLMFRPVSKGSKEHDSEDSRHREDERGQFHLGKGVAGKGCIEPVTLDKAEIVVGGTGNRVVYSYSHNLAKCIYEKICKGMSPNKTVVEVLVNVVLFSMVFSNGIILPLVNLFLSITHMCPSWLAVTQGCRAWLQVCCRARSS